MNRSEREAFLRAFLLKAKKLGVPAMKLIENFILTRFFGFQNNVRDRMIRNYFVDETILPNQMTIFETYSKIRDIYKRRLAEIQSGVHAKDIKRKVKNESSRQ